MTWEMATATKLDGALVDALFDNEIAGIRIREFLTGSAVALAARGVVEHGLDYYADVNPPIGKIGITQFEYRHSVQSRADYFALAPAANERRKQIFAASGDPVSMVMEVLSAARPVELAREPDGSVYFAGLVRVVNEALLHCDWAPFDAPGWAIEKINGQITWNIYCQMPASGGAVTVYNRPWDPTAQRFQIPDSYGYTDELVRGREFVRIEPGVGDLIFFNSRNPHRIDAGDGAQRISVSSFVGRGPRPELALWS